MRKLYYFFVYAGEVIFIWSVIFILSISLQSIVIKGKVEYGGRCYQAFDDVFINTYQYEGVMLNRGGLKCNTYYLEYESTLTEEENLVFLVSISRLFKEHEVNSNIHVTITNDNFQIMSTIVGYKVSYTKSII